MRKKLILLLLAWTVLLFVSCSGMRAPQETKTTKEPIEQRTEEPIVTDFVQTAQTEPVFGCDVLFFGDSITADSNFKEYFPELRIVNSGVYGDTVYDLQRRVAEVRDQHPEKIFLLVGINGLSAYNVEICLVEYEELLDMLREECPNASVYIQSLLPVGAEFDAYGTIANDTVRTFNRRLEAIAKERDLPYIDLYSLYVKDGALNPALTRDGLHLNFNCYGPWAEAIAEYLAP